MIFTPKKAIVEWKKSCLVYLIIYRVLYIPDGAGFLPSNVCPWVDDRYGKRSAVLGPWARANKNSV